MVAPITARASKMRIMLGDNPPSVPQTPIIPISFSKANPSVVTVGASDIAKYKDGDYVTIDGVTGTGWTILNGSRVIGAVNATDHTFQLVGIDTSAATGTEPSAVGTVQPANQPGVITYTAPCGLNSKTLTLTKNLQEIDIPDCDDPDKVSWIGRDAQNLSAAVSGDGVLAAQSVPAWTAAFQSIDSINVEIEIEFETGTLIYTGKFQVDNLTFSAQQGQRVQLSINMQSDGELAEQWQPT